tara:strand:- start:242 stop:382 length:141 start_codon:yes stop_codon:yes gene_type:complete
MSVGVIDEPTIIGFSISFAYEKLNDTNNICIDKNFLKFIVTSLLNN